MARGEAGNGTGEQGMVRAGNGTAEQGMLRAGNGTAEQAVQLAQSSLSPAQGGNKSSRDQRCLPNPQKRLKLDKKERKKQRKSQYYVSASSLTWAALRKKK